METTNLCKCNNCDGIFIDTNPQVNAPVFEGNISQFDELVSIEDMRACPVCLTDEYLNDNVESLPSDVKLVESV